MSSKAFSSVLSTGIMTANDKSADNNGLTNELINENNEELVIVVNRDTDQISTKSSLNRSVIPVHKNVEQNKCADSPDSPANKSSNRNAINFMGELLARLIRFN